MKFKLKKCFSTLLIFAMLVTLVPVGSVRIAFADSSQIFNYRNNIFQISIIPDGSSGNTLKVTLVGINSSSGILFPSRNEILSQIPEASKSLNISKQIPSISLDDTFATTPLAPTKMVLEDGYTELPAGFLNHNTTLTTIQINVGPRDFTLNANAFASNSALETVSIDTSTAHLQGGVFNTCPNLRSVDFKTTKVYFDGSSNFASCSQLSTVLFKGDVFFQGGQEFNQVSPDFSLTFEKNVTASTPVFKNTNVKELIFKGDKNMISSDFFSGNEASNASIQTLKISGSFSVKNPSTNSNTTFASKAFSYASIDNFIINSPTCFANATLNHCNIANLQINVDNRETTAKSLTYDTQSSRLGYYSKVNNLIFAEPTANDYDNNNCMELNCFPLGETDASSLNIDNIYFKNSKFKYIGDSPYKRTDGHTTTIYGQGAAQAWDEYGRLITAATMYKNWAANSNCVYKNYTHLSNFTYIGAEYLTTTQQVPYDFSYVVGATVDIYSSNGVTIKEANKKLKIRYSGKRTDVEEPQLENFYRVLKPIDASTDVKKIDRNSEYIYEDENHQYYQVLTDSTVTLPKGNHQFYIEIGGEQISASISIKDSKIDKITNILPVSGDMIQTIYGTKFDNNSISVSVTYENGSSGTLGSYEYNVIPPSDIKVGQNNTYTLEVPMAGSTSVQKTFDVYVAPDTVTGFNSYCSITQMYVGQKISVQDGLIQLNDISKLSTDSLENGISTGFTFLVDNKECDSYTIKAGVNNISIRYRGFTKTNAISIFGKEDSITKVEAAYISSEPVFGNTSIKKDAEHLEIKVYYESLNGDYITLSTPEDFEKVTFSPFSITPNTTTEVEVAYDNVKAVSPITVVGAQDDIEKISSVTYNGDLTIGTALTIDMFTIELQLKSGKVISSNTEPSILANAKVLTPTITSTATTVVVTYNSLSTSFYIFGQPSQTTATPTATPVATPTPSSITNTSVPLQDPSITPLATPATQEPTATPQPIVKGKTYTINNVKYKVKTFNGRTGTVVTIGYNKSAKSIAVKSFIKIKGYSFHVSSIGNNAFKNCKSLSGTVNINNSITSVGKNAFYNCSNVKKVIIGAKVSSLGARSFYQCKKLTYVDLRPAKSLRKVGSAAFKKNNKKRIFKVKKSTKIYFVSILKGKY